MDNMITAVQILAAGFITIVFCYILVRAAAIAIYKTRAEYDRHHKRGEKDNGQV